MSIMQLLYFLSLFYEGKSQESGLTVLDREAELMIGFLGSAHSFLLITFQHLIVYFGDELNYLNSL